MGIGAAQNLYDQAVLHGKIIRIHRLSRHKSFRISLDQGCATTRSFWPQRAASVNMPSVPASFLLCIQILFNCAKLGHISAAAAEISG